MNRWSGFKSELEPMGHSCISEAERFERVMPCGRAVVLRACRKNEGRTATCQTKATVKITG